MRGGFRDGKGVVLLRNPDQETRWIDARLRGEPDQATRHAVLGVCRHDEHRVVDDLEKSIEAVPALRHQPIVDHPGAVWRRSGGVALTCDTASDGSRS